ncbi:MAG: dihydrofolate reductase [Bacteroidetes bacterium]|nr:MAG: dihydrofolate reductase [Bacteroidota bacterium]
MKKPAVNVSVFIAASLDGFIARPDGDVSWLDEYEPLGEGEDAGYSELFNKVDSLVLGRGSFEKVLEFDWPYGDKPITVLSSSLSKVPEKLKGSVRIDNSVPLKLLENLAAEGCRHIYLDGGQVIQSFLREGLVDDITLTIIPVLLGQGVPLFGSLEKDIKLKLLESRSWDNGFVQSKYKVVE